MEVLFCGLIVAVIILFIFCFILNGEIDDNKRSITSVKICKECGGIFTEDRMKKVEFYGRHSCYYDNNKTLYFCEKHTPNYDIIREGYLGNSYYREEESIEVKKPNYKI